MPFAAVPDYLGEDFGTAAPGHRFYLYFRVWEHDQKSGALAVAKSKAAAVNETLRLTPNDLKAMAALAARQRQLADASIWQMPAKSVAPLATGLGMEHPLENGFAFLNPYGLPYLPGSGIKGVLRQAARELRKDGEPGWAEGDADNNPIQTLFGTADGDQGRRGALLFWDAFPVLARGTESLAAEVMTPHQTAYYQGKEPPHDSGSPNPILFLAIPPGTGFTFYVGCKPALLKPELAADDGWKPLLRAAFEHAFDWLGFGAKTAVGYGHLAMDTAALEEREAELQQQKQRQETERQIAQSTQGLPADAAWLEEQTQRGAWPDNGAFLDAMEAWLEKFEQDTLTIEAWQRIESEMTQRYDAGILSNPDATKGRQQKPKYKDRSKNLAKRLLALKPGKSAP